MMSKRFLPSAGWLAWGVLCGAALPVGAAEEAAGVVRIQKPAATVRAQSDAIQPVVCETDMPANMGFSGACATGDCPGGSCYRNDWRTSDWTGYPFHQRTQAHSLAVDCWKREHCCKHDCGLYYHDCTGQDMINYFRCKFGYFIPTGCGGAGCPPVGKYARVYPLDPNYSDGRDGQAWAAQGYGVPIAVPLAPVVGHQWNYSWGTPASRLTPISRVAPY